MPIVLAPRGDEFPASSGSTTSESEAAIDRLAGGGFVLAWTDKKQSFGLVDIKAQAFDATGAKVGPELVLEAQTGMSYQKPAVAGLASGNFVLSWSSIGAAGDSSEWGVLARIYGPSGIPAGGVFLVNSTTSSIQRGPAITALASGGFVITWQDESRSADDPYGYAIRGQLFDPSGAKSGGEFLVNTVTFPDQLTPDVTALESGGFVVAWYSDNEIKAQIFTSVGSKSGGEFLVNSVTSGYQSSPKVAGLPGGGFVAIWTSPDPAGAQGVNGQIFDGAGNKIGSEFLVDTTIRGSQFQPSVTALAQGGFMVSWTDIGGPGGDPFGSSVRAQIFDALGNKVGGEFLLNSSLTSNESQPVITQLSTNEIVAAWTAGSDIAARIFFPEVSGTEGDDIYAGTGSRDVYRGLAGNDVIDGGAGADQMAGGAGDDVYAVDNNGDLVIENAGEGTDEVRTALAAYTLAANVENLTATSNAARDFRGNSGNNVVTGGAGNDILRLYDGGDDTVVAGAGSDNIFFIGTLTSDDIVNGGADTDTLVLQGAYGALALTANITQIENVSILGGNNANFAEPGTNRYDYVLTTHDSNFAAGVQARINGAALLEGEDFTFDGSAETDAKFVVYGGKGKDTLTGGLGNDIFFYAEERFASGDTVNGGAGYDGMFLRGNYTIDFNAPGYTGLFTNIENLTLTSATDERYARGGGTEFDYNLTLSDAIVKPGETLTVSGALLMASETMILDGSAELDGLLRLFGGRAADTLKGGAQADILHGGLGADQLTGNGGADVFRFQATAESDSANMDRILDFTAGTDKVDLARIDADSNSAGNQAFAWIGSAAFGGIAGQLRAYEQDGSWFVEGDTDGDTVADLVIRITVAGGPLTQADFLP